MKNFVFVICLALVGMVSFAPLTADASMVVTYQKDEPTAQEKYAVCCELDAQRIIDLETALDLERRGILTIEKVGSGVYQVQTSGGISILILIEDN